jgi:hypothetical protein
MQCNSFPGLKPCPNRVLGGTAEAGLSHNDFTGLMDRADWLTIDPGQCRSFLRFWLFWQYRHSRRHLLPVFHTTNKNQAVRGYD